MSEQKQDKVQKQEENVDAGITKVQGWLESLKKQPHTAWVILIIGLAALIGGLAAWLL